MATDITEYQLRLQAWERAKGEMRAMLMTCQGMPYNERQRLYEHVENFIKHLDDSNWIAS